MLFFFGLIVFFAFFYTGIVFNPKEQADNLRNNGGFVLGYRPGEQTAQHLEHVIYRLTFVGAVYLGLIALIPEFLIARLSASSVTSFIATSRLTLSLSKTTRETCPLT